MIYIGLYDIDQFNLRRVSMSACMIEHLKVAWTDQSNLAFYDFFRQQRSSSHVGAMISKNNSFFITNGWLSLITPLAD